MRRRVTSPDEKADKVAKKGTTLHTTETPLQAETLKKLLNLKIAKKYRLKADDMAATKKWRDFHKIWVEYKGKPRNEAVEKF